jgi:hypothetical protein
MMVPISAITSASTYAEAPALHEQDQQHVEAGDEHAVKQRNVKQQVQSDGRTDHFSQIAGGDRDLRADPEPES